jgi:hypothetical protein
MLEPERTRCSSCDGRLWMAYHKTRTIATLDGLARLTLKVRCCENAACQLYHRPYRPEQEGSLALPHGEFGLDVIALIGTLRYAQHQSVPEIHQALRARGVSVAERTVTNLLHRYEELVALRLTDRADRLERLVTQGRVILAIDGLQPDVGHEVLWVLRDCLSGEVLLARSLLGGAEEDLVPLLKEVKAGLPVPIHGVISDGQQSLRNAVQTALPDVPHQLCQFHYLREAARPIYEADRHAKKELKKLVRGVRPIERRLEARAESETKPEVQAQLEAVSGYCQAVRSALTDDGRPPLSAPGLKLDDRLQQIHASIERVAEKGGSHQSLLAWISC